MIQTIRTKLLALADEEYRKFQSTLIPGEDRLLGVRLPALRELAKEIVKGDWREYLNSAQDEYYEEIMLQGLVIGYAKTSPEEILHFTAKFIPKITNWGVCDSFCTGLKLAKKQPELVWNFILPYLRSEKEFDIRFAVIMMLAHYMTDKYIDDVLACLDQVRHDGYLCEDGRCLGRVGLLREISGKNHGIPEKLQSGRFHIQQIPPEDPGILPRRPGGQSSHPGHETEIESIQK